MTGQNIYQRMAEFRATFNGNPRRSISEEYYRWKIGNNPFGPGHIALEKRRKTDVGSATITPKPLTIIGNRQGAAEIGDTFTLADFRRQGIFSNCVNECRLYAVSNGQIVIYGTPNAQSQPGYEKKLGFASCPNANIVCMKKYLKPLPDQQKNPQFRLMEFLFQKRPVVDSDGTIVRPLLSLNDGADGLWGKNRFVFAVVRNWKYLKWRFLDNPDEYQLLGAFRENRCTGYMVLKRTWDGKAGFLCDFISFNDDINVFNHLLCEAENYFRTWDVDQVQLMTVKGSTYFRELFKSGYFVTRENVPVIVYEGTNAGRELLKHEGVWHFTFADTDFI